MGSLQEATILALFVQAILYGIYLVSVTGALRCLLFGDRGWNLRERINWLLFSTTILFFVFSTSDLSLSLNMSIAAMRGQTTTYNKYGTVNNILENTTVLMADAVLVYRCWIVYGKSWVVIFVPVLLWLAALSCSILVICSQLIGTWESSFYHLWVGFYSSNILTNIYATAAIIFRILAVANYTSHRQGRRSRLRKVSRTLIESGSLYTLTSSVNLASSIIGGPPIMRYVSDATNFSMTGITFNLIIIRIFLQRHYYDADFNDSAATPHVSSLKFQSHNTPELCTPTTATSNEESYTEDQNRVNIPLNLPVEYGSNENWRDFSKISISSSKKDSLNIQY